MPVLATARDLATTFSTDGDITPWERVQQYHQVTEYTDHNPGQGSTAVATALNLPRSRIASWVDQGSKPNPVHAIDTATEHGWLDLDADSPAARPWVELVAWIYSGGTIHSKMRHPSFYVDDTIHILAEPPLTILEHALAEIGAGMTEHTRGDRRAREIRVEYNPILVGRMLQAMGAPRGGKRDNNQLRLPGWLFDASPDTQRVFARIYIQNRGSIQDRDRSPVRFRAEWVDEYHEQVAQLFQSASGLEDGVHLSDYTLKLSADALDAILADS